ncbi:MAG: hypothetical protein EBU93_00510 [Chlamydiae bacterium]|nr:hypothetical protein [Chlamydiota bacterium]
MEKEQEERGNKMIDKLKDLKGRLLIHSIVIIVASGLIYTSIFSFSKFLILATIIGLILVGNVEFSQFLKSKNIRYSLAPSMPMIFTFPTAILFWVIGYKIYPGVIFLAFLSVLLFILLAFEKVENSIFMVASQVLAHVYITIPLSLMIGVLFIDAIGVANDGRIWLAYLICVSKGADVGGYFFGSLLGKRPLAVTISPKKTIEGSYGAIVFSVLISLLFFGLAQIVPRGLFHLGFAEALFLGLVISVISQLGDLSESLFKRDAKIKDSSSIPAVGGVLDVVDSLLFTTPFLFVYLILFK